MHKKTRTKSLAAACLLLLAASCGIPPRVVREPQTSQLPARYNAASDSVNTAKTRWRDFFADPALTALIDTALKNNQELNITLQEIEIARNEIRIRKGEYMPFVGLQGGAGVEKPGRYTFRGATEAATEIKPGKEMPDPLPFSLLQAFATWEVDIWHKLRNARKAALNRYLASVEGRHFTVTNLVAEIATSYYELLALDSQLAIVRQNIAIQTNALEIVRLQKQSARVTELAVRRFEAQVLNTRSIQYDLQQRIIETENRINFLVGRYPQPVARQADMFTTVIPTTVRVGLPAQLLANRPDIRQAELNLVAANLDVKAARANFYPSLRITAAVGLEAFNPAYLAQTPQSLLYSLAGDLVAPLVNRNAIKGAYASANARQMQAVYQYERTLLNAYNEVANQVSNITNLEQKYALKDKEVQALTQSITISNNLFSSARADYMEVLLTQRDAQESKFQLVETKMQQLHAIVYIYRALGGGWN